MIMGSSQYEARPCVALHCVAPIVNMLQLNAKIDQKPILAYALASKHNARRKTLRHIVNQPLDWVYPCYSHNLSPSLISHLSFLTASHHLSSLICHFSQPLTISHLSFLTASHHLSSLIYHFSQPLTISHLSQECLTDLQFLESWGGRFRLLVVDECTPFLVEHSHRQHVAMPAQPWREEERN